MTGFKPWPPPTKSPTKRPKSPPPIVFAHDGLARVDVLQRLAADLHVIALDMADEGNTRLAKLAQFERAVLYSVARVEYQCEF